MIVYHMDCNESLNEGMEIKLRSFSSLRNENRNVLEKLFPDGISKHGLNYLEDCFYDFPFYTQTAAGEKLPPCAFLDSVFNIPAAMGSHFSEIIFELVRRGMFPLSPSRFQSLFAVESLHDFHLWEDIERFSKEKPIYEIMIPDNSPHFDSNWLKAGFAAGAYNDAPNAYFAFSPTIALNLPMSYWAQEATDSPRWEYIIPLPITIGRRVR